MDFLNFVPTYREINCEDIFEYRFTIFTSIYNRENTIHRVFDSLNSQTFKNFELVLINDGSSDNSHSKVLELLKTAKFDVNYINNINNQHKMACFFEAIKLAKGEFLLPLDSDDKCVEDALFEFDKAYQSIPTNIRNKISGVTALCMDINGELIGSEFPSDFYYSNTFKQNLYFPNESERWGFTKTSVLRNIEINEKLYSKGLIPEGLIWELIAKQGFETLYINKLLRIYYTDASNRLSIANHEQNSFGMAIFSIAVLNWFSKDYLWSNPKYILKRTYTLLRAAHYLNYEKQDYIQALPNRKLKMIFNIVWPFKNLLK